MTVGRKGWSGRPPQHDDDARKRIIDAALMCIERRGPAQTTLSDIADAVGITRRTVYRYFATTEDLFSAAAEVALGSFIARIEAITADMDDVARQLVEVVAFIIERLPEEPLLTFLLDNDRTSQFSRRMLAPEVIVRCRTILRHSRIDWDALGCASDADLDELVEFLLRVIQSMVVAPGEPARDGAALRKFLHRWVGPALTAGQ